MSYFEEIEQLWRNITKQCTTIRCDEWHHCIHHNCNEWETCVRVNEMKDKYKEELLKLQIKYL